MSGERGNGRSKSKRAGGNKPCAGNGGRRHKTMRGDDMQHHKGDSALHARVWAFREFLHGLSAGSENDIAEDVANQIEEYEERVEAEDLVFGSEDENGNLEYSIPYSIISEEEEYDDE